MTARIRVLRFACALLLTAAGCIGGPAAATTHWLRPAAVHGFATIHAELQRIVDTQGRVRTNHFCAVVRVVHEPRSATSEGDS